MTHSLKPKASSSTPRRATPLSLFAAFAALVSSSLLLSLYAIPSSGLFLGLRTPEPLSLAPLACPTLPDRRTIIRRGTAASLRRTSVRRTPLMCYCTRQSAFVAPVGRRQWSSCAVEPLRRSSTAARVHLPARRLTASSLSRDARMRIFPPTSASPPSPYLSLSSQAKSRLTPSASTTASRLSGRTTACRARRGASSTAGCGSFATGSSCAKGSGSEWTRSGAGSGSRRSHALPLAQDNSSIASLQL